MKRHVAIVVGMLCSRFTAHAQVTQPDTAEKKVEEVCVTVVGGTPVRAMLTRGTRDSLYLRVDDLRYAIARKTVATLELRGPTLSESQASQHHMANTFTDGEND
jgi:hypothetical protein